MKNIIKENIATIKDDILRATKRYHYKPNKHDIINTKHYH